MLRSVRNFLISFSNSGDILSSCPCLRPDFLVLAAIPSFIPFTVISLSCSARSSSTRINSSQRVSHYGYPFSFCPLSRSDFSPLNLHGCPTENSNMRLSAFYQYFPNLSSEFVCYVCATRMCYASKLTTFLENFQNPKHKKNPGKSRFSEVLIVFCIRLKLSLAELRSATSCFETVLKSSEWRFPLIFQGFSGYSTKIAPPFNHKNGGTLSTHGRGKCGIYNAQKVFGLIILHLRIDVHSCLAVFMPRKILNCLWINASIQKIGNVGMP